MAFNKTGETKVYKSGDKLGTKLANSDHSNRYTVDEMIEDVDSMTADGLEEEEAVKVLDNMISRK